MIQPIITCDKSLLPNDYQVTTFNDVELPGDDGGTILCTLKFENQQTEKILTIIQQGKEIIVYRGTDWTIVRDAFNDDWAVDFDELVAGLWLPTD